MAEQRQNNVELTDEEKEQRAKKRSRTIVTVVSVVAAVLIVVIVLLLLLVKCEPEENVDPPVEHTHTYSSWVVVDEPTCTEEGLRERTCSCGEKETETIAALGHTAGEAVRENEKAPTCTEKGSYEEVVCCAVCGEEVSRKTVEVAALGHTAGEAGKENEVAATCLSAGSYEEVVCCTVCGEEMSRKTVTVDALGHDYKGEVTDEALCLVPGEMTYTCTRCNDSYKEEIAPLRHSWGETKPGQAPTCTAAGYTSYETCTRCGYSNRETIPATGHTWGEWEVTTAATCEKTGEQTHICSVCGFEEKEEIAVDPTAHKPDMTDYITNQNEHWYTCLLCGGKASVEEHDYTGNAQNCKICGVTDSNYFNFTPLDDSSGYGVGQKVTAFDEPISFDDIEVPYISTEFTDKVKLPDYYNGTPITKLTGMTINVTIKDDGEIITEQLSTTPFAFNSSLTNIELPKFITEIPDQAFYECNALESVSIPDNVASIGEEAFFGCEALESIEVPCSVETIGMKAFACCNLLQSVTLHDGLTTIGGSAFLQCEKLTDITIPDTVTTIQAYAFMACSLLTSIEIPEGVTLIAFSVFSLCTSLEEITIPKTVKEIGYNAFDGCNKLKTVNYRGSEDEWEEIDFDGDNDPLEGATINCNYMDE